MKRMIPEDEFLEFLDTKCVRYERGYGVLDESLKTFLSKNAVELVEVYVKRDICIPGGAFMLPKLYKIKR